MGGRTPTVKCDYLAPWAPRRCDGFLTRFIKAYLSVLWCRRTVATCTYTQEFGRSIKRVVSGGSMYCCTTVRRLFSDPSLFFCVFVFFFCVYEEDAVWCMACRMEMGRRPFNSCFGTK